MFLIMFMWVIIVHLPVVMYNMLANKLSPLVVYFLFRNGIETPINYAPAYLLGADVPSTEKRKELVSALFLKARILVG